MWVLYQVFFILSTCIFFQFGVSFLPFLQGYKRIYMESASNPPFLEKYQALFQGLTEMEYKEEDDDENARKRFSGAVKECELPVIDLDREECKREIGDAAREWGFFQVVNHGISRDVLTGMRDEQVRLFRQPFCKKVSGDDGPFSNNSYCWGNPAATSLFHFSWSEALHIPLSKISESKDFSANTVSSPIEEFANRVSELAQKVAAMLAEYLGCESTFFKDNCSPSSCYLRLNRYPPCSISPRLFGLVPHTDSDFLTILYQDNIGGLQLVKDGEWISVKPNPDVMIINIGDLFQAWSNGVYRSIEHRVMTNREVERFSVAYFLCPSFDAVIQSCSSNTSNGAGAGAGEERAIYRKFSFKDYRDQVREDVHSTGNKIGLPRFLL